MKHFDPSEISIDWSATLADRIDHYRRYIEDHPDAKATIDFETRSACDLKKHGAWNYSKHPTTEVMCLAYKLPMWLGTELWHMAHEQHLIGESPAPLELFAWILAGGLVEAHNVFFEKCIWAHQMMANRNWPEVPFHSWRCSAAKASASALPRALDGAGQAMNLPIQKDKVGWALMLKMSKPRKPRKAELEAWTAEHGDEPMPILYHEEEDDLYRLWSYCKDDVRTEEHLSEVVPELSEDELALWQMDQWMNWRGARFDLKLARAALKMAEQWKKKLNKELEIMTGISAGSKRQQVKDWLSEHEALDVPDTTADTLEWMIEKVDMSGRARRILEIVKEVNKTSTRKFQTIINKADPDDWRVRDLLMYHGAGTGRWSGKGVQVQNFPKGDFDDLDMDEACQWVLDGEIEWIEALYGDVMAVLSAISRGTVIADEGRELIVADYSAIEARVVLWLADAMGALDVFRRGEDIYCDMATGIYGRTITKKDKAERQFGKQAILGLGYGMGFMTFFLTCRKYKIYFTVEDCLRIMGAEQFEKYVGWVRNQLWPEKVEKEGVTVTAKEMSDKKKQAARQRRQLEEAREDPKKVVHELALMKYTVDVYRRRYPEVKDMWKAQEAAAIQAIQTGETVECGKVKWYLSDTGKWLYCELPCGRRLSYTDPEVKNQRTSWGEVRPGIRYMRMGKTQKWERTATYGGKIVENITQAVARDIMANAMLLAWQEGCVYDTIMSVHDELVCEVDVNEGSLSDFEELMSSLPPWASTCPITAEADRFARYRK